MFSTTLKSQKKLVDIQIRDPFIVPVHTAQKYYLYGTTDSDWRGVGTGFDTYISQDLVNWQGPIPVFRPSDDFWADRNFWAPEVYEYHGRFFMFATFCSRDGKRGTQILVSDKPEGQFIPHSKGPVTPDKWMCLDGTFFLDEDNRPWIVFCREWTEIYDGQICAAELDCELKYAVSEPHVLFKSSQAPWVSKLTLPEIQREGFVTDGPFLYRTKAGELLLIWSSFSQNGYAVGISRSQSGKIHGPWEHSDKPLLDCDGGHAMVFRTFEGQNVLAYHVPNTPPNERTKLVSVVDCGVSLKISDYN